MHQPVTPIVAQLYKMCSISDGQCAAARAYTCTSRQVPGCRDHGRRAFCGVAQRCTPRDTEMLLACKEKLVRNFQEVDRLSLNNFQERIDVITFTLGRQVATRELIMNLQDLPVTSNTESNIEKQLHFC